MSFLKPALRILFPSALTLGFISLNAQALDFDWQGQFQAETNTLFGYSNAPAGTSGGYSVPLNGDTPANFQNLFLSLKPKILVNDNVSIHGDLWFNSPDAGFFGSNAPVSPTYHSSRTGNAMISARAFFAELATDFGTFRVGRVPLNYGLGVVWNSESGRRSRLPSYGDAMTLTTKLGAFKFSPVFVKYQQQFVSNAGVANTQASGITDYALMLSYANDDEQLDVGLLFLRRLALQNSGVLNPFGTTSSPLATAGYAYNLWDFYAKKKSGMFTFAAEVPIASGLVASQSYSTVAGAVKASAAISDQFSLKVNAGSASGQASGSAANKLSAFYFHPDYRPGLLMFNYNYQNIADGSGSFYDNPITNARFVSFAGEYTAGKFSHELLGLFGMADQVAVGSGTYFNTLSGHYETDGSGVAQEKGLGFELDYSLGYDWDEYTRFGVDTGLYFPGNFFKFTGAPTLNSPKTIFGAQFSMTVKF